MARDARLGGCLKGVNVEIIVIYTRFEVQVDPIGTYYVRLMKHHIHGYIVKVPILERSMQPCCPMGNL